MSETVREVGPQTSGIQGDDRWQLVVVHHAHGRLVGHREWLDRTLEVGRGGATFAERDLLDDPLLSSRHCVFLHRGGRVRITDRGSTNGTRINGETVREAVLESGDLVEIGSMLLLVQKSATAAAFRHPRLLGASDGLRSVLEQLSGAAHRDVIVLLLGETGVGKELLAREVHSESGRSGAFVAVNCGALADSVLQSELFGHERGAFSGAAQRRPGLVATAEGGTLLLDEIGDASPQLQVALLRLLQEREYRPVGSDRPRRADVRFVAATHKPLERLVADGSFRRDLYARLAQWVVRIPPLRERIDDVAALIVAGFDGCGRCPSRALVRELLRRSWPGNAREVNAVVQRIIHTSGSQDPIEAPNWLSTALIPASAAVSEDSAASVGKRFSGPRPTPEQLVEGLRSVDGSMVALARQLGVGRTTLYRWLKEAGVDPGAARGS